MKLTRAIIDFSQICFAQFYGQVQRDDDLDSEEDKIHFFKHCVFSKLADIHNTLKPNEIILAIDSKSWREKEFQYYKAKRKIDRADKAEEYRLIFACIDSLKQDIRNMNYKVIETNGAEGDDIIAILCNRFEKDPDTEVVYIVSTDKDFQQLTSKKIKLFNHLKGETICCEDAQTYLVKLILGGDASDGIPNVKSDDDTFINSDKRQTQYGPKAIDKILATGLDNFLLEDAIFRQNYERNQRLITLTEEFIPKDIWKAVNAIYDEINIGFKRKSAIEIGNYFRKINQNGLIQKINNFI